MAAGDLCPWCSAPRVAGETCPRCGANYAKAELIKAHGRAPAAPAVAVAEEPLPPENVPAVIVGAESRAVDDPRLEWQLSVAAIPAALALALVFHFLTPALQRIFFGMPVHELGHAVTAWLCGYFAIPTLWKTVMFSESRGWLAPVVLAGALLYLMVRAYLAEKPAYIVLLAALLLVQGIGTFGIDEEKAEMLIVFGGDGMGMVLAALLMASFFFGKRTGLYKGWLRWGFVIIGAAAFVDMFATWWVAQSNADVIPFGENEGSGLSDPMRLLEEFGWQINAIVRRYVLLGVASLAGLALVYAWGVRRARRAAKAAA